jgi:hypothetical protein
MIELAVTCLVGFGVSAAVITLWMLRAVRPRTSPLHRER